jgi:hypothetical protein
MDSLLEPTFLGEVAKLVRARPRQNGTSGWRLTAASERVEACESTVVMNL